jgi:hypothetical protein
MARARRLAVAVRMGLHTGEPLVRDDGVEEVFEVVEQDNQPAVLDEAALCIAELIQAARVQLGAAGDAAWAEGRALSLEEAVELALADEP